ncbi:hypothetical protein Skr01_19780 [Sphaerisporangium krabiense]|uniref:Uncharacterized protein n=1 Tax=Sphaerisporangium krabiense TaxID=763782 RepID=A0A7W8Z5Q1_9ACTN|nr:DUF6157 family protein [Sphaerisporangium krabiense]MBB5627735.1 hypothetical protein [Sphaerisporangium krabiense]GII61893.1 hypothetical protein Skr01_19780 [Sphaerisporangium krabiense]
MDLNYYKTLIAVADDCPVSSGVVPEGRGGRRSVAVVQYEMLAGSPYVYTQEDVLFESWLRRQDMPDISEDRRQALRDEFFSRSQACLRASPLPKKYGWGLAFDAEGRVALCPMESREYGELRDDADTTVLKALRSRRA